MQTDLHPVVCISWNDVQAYIRWLNGQTGKTFRLLSEAEWEYAARAGSVARYPWGPDATCRYANGADESPWPHDSAGRVGKMKCNDGFSYTSPVGSYPPNDWGLHDMIGNVWEWTADCYRDSYNGTRVEISADCGRPLIRGGSWYDIPESLRVSNRYWIATVMARASFLGFRLAQDR